MHSLVGRGKNSKIRTNVDPIGIEGMIAHTVHLNGREVFRRLTGPINPCSTIVRGKPDVVGCIATHCYNNLCVGGGCGINGNIGDEACPSWSAPFEPRRTAIGCVRQISVFMSDPYDRGVGLVDIDCTAPGIVATRLTNRGPVSSPIRRPPDTHATSNEHRQQLDGDHVRAVKAFESAVTQSQDNADFHYNLAASLRILGRFDEAISRVQKAYLVDPLAVESRNEALWTYYFSGRMEDTVQQARKAIELEPQAGLPYAMLALAYAQTGRRDEGLQAADKAARLADSPSVMATAASALARLGQRARATQLVNQALESAKGRYICRFLVAGAYADLGDLQKALDSLERGYAERST